MSVTEKIQERFSSRLVYGDPVESDGVVLIPASRVMGGGGGGSDDKGAEGAGFGLSASPAGAWVIEEGGARWKPAIDMAVVIAGGYAVAVAYFFFTWRIERSRAKRG